MMRIACLAALVASVVAEEPLPPMTLVEKEKNAALNDDEEKAPGISVRVVGGDQVKEKSKYPFLVEWEGGLTACAVLNQRTDIAGYAQRSTTLLLPSRCQMWRFHDS
jgi:hypothetical protein